VRVHVAVRFVNVYTCNYVVNFLGWNISKFSTFKTMSDSDSEHLKRKREKIEEKEEENPKAPKTSNALLAQLHAERNQRRPPIEKATPAAVGQNTTMMTMSSVSNLKQASSLVSKATRVAAATNNKTAWSNVGRLNSIASANNNKRNLNQPMKTVKNSDEVERVLERAKQLEATTTTTTKKKKKRRSLPKIETKPIEIPKRGRKWVEEPSIPERMDNEEEEVRILSYNIWFDNNHAQMARTEYLGRVIESCDPDVLCLQEVTLPILFVMQGQVWFEKYHLCAQPSEKELQCGYFCVVLVKKKETIRKTRVEKDGNIVRVDEKGGTEELGGFVQGTWKAHKSTFASSIMGRNLQYAYDLGFPKLCVATSHLESWIMENPQLMAEKRKQQLKQSLEHLGGRFEDVIFIGDMNWNDSKDGLCPIVAPWEDAWLKLRPESDGYSYDAKRNTMLRGNLYARFDRAFTKLKNFELQSMQMVGTNPEVNGQTYERPYIEKGEQKKIKVDVLPSDHYGLLLILKKKSLFDDEEEGGVIDLTSSRF